MVLNNRVKIVILLIQISLVLYLDALPLEGEWQHKHYQSGFIGGESVYRYLFRPTGEGYLKFVSYKSVMKGIETPSSIPDPPRVDFRYLDFDIFSYRFLLIVWKEDTNPYGSFVQFYNVVQGNSERLILKNNSRQVFLENVSSNS